MLARIWCRADTGRRRFKPGKGHPGSNLLLMYASCSARALTGWGTKLLDLVLAFRKSRCPSCTRGCQMIGPEI